MAIKRRTWGESGRAIVLKHLLGLDACRSWPGAESPHSVDRLPNPGLAACDPVGRVRYFALAKYSALMEANFCHSSGS
jgi:hypothetical protein